MSAYITYIMAPQKKKKNNTTLGHRLPFIQPAKDRAAVKFLNSVLRSREMLNAYDALPNINRPAINTAFRAWATGQKLSADAQKTLHALLNVRSADEFFRFTRDGMAWIAREIGTRPYALIAEVASGNTLHNSLKAKSSAWLAAPLVRFLGRPPAAIIPFHDGGWLAGDLVRTAVAQGILDFVHVDDAIYSGSQKAILVNEMGALRIRDVPRLYIAAAYATQKGLAKVRARVATVAKWVHVALHASGTMNEPTAPPNILPELIGKGHTVGPTMSILPFKVPNEVSFGPSSLGAALGRAVPPPVYKRIHVSHYVPATVFYNTPENAIKLARWGIVHQKKLFESPALLLQQRDVFHLLITGAQYWNWNASSPDIVSSKTLANNVLRAIEKSAPPLPDVLSFIARNLEYVFGTQRRLTARHASVFVRSIYMLTNRGVRNSSRTNTVRDTLEQLCPILAALGMHAKLPAMVTDIVDRTVSVMSPMSNEANFRSTMFALLGDHMILYSAAPETTPMKFVWRANVGSVHAGEIRVNTQEQHAYLRSALGHLFLRYGRADPGGRTALVRRFMYFIIAMNSANLVAWYVRTFKVDLTTGPDASSPGRHMIVDIPRTRTWVELAAAWTCTNSVRGLQGSTSSRKTVRVRRRPRALPNGDTRITRLAGQLRRLSTR